MSFSANKKGGYSIIEILIAMVLFTASISLTIILFSNSQNVLVNRENNILAKSLSNEGLNGANVILKNNWQSIADGQYGLSWENNTWSFSDIQDTQGIFTRKITITTMENSERKIKSAVTWQESPLRPEGKVELATILTNWVNVVDTGGDDGGGGITGDWQNPQTLGSVDLGPGNSATDLDVINKIVYMSAEASALVKPDFWIIDATDGQNPVIKSSLDVDSNGLNAVDATQNYAYAANQKTDAQLLVIDTSNILSPAVTASFQLPGVSGSNAVGNAIFYYANKVYIGTKEATGPEFHIIDVTDPAYPNHLGSFEINDNINDIYISDNRAYLATDLGNAGLMVLDVSNPSAIALLGQTFSSDTKSVFNIHSSLTLLGPAQEFYTIDTINPADMIKLGFIGAGNIINDIVARDTLAFLATANSNREFQVINISDPSNPTFHSSFNFPQVATGIDYEDNLVYVSVRSNDGLRIITSAP